MWVGYPGKQLGLFLKRSNGNFLCGPAIAVLDTNINNLKMYSLLKVSTWLFPVELIHISEKVAKSLNYLPADIKGNKM